MPENNTENADKRNDFTTKNFIQRNQHNRDINGIKKRLDDLELLVGNKEKFISTFVAVCSDSTQVNEAIAKSVDSHDNHKIKISVMAISKWLAVALASAFIGAWIQRTMTPAFNPQELVDALKTQSNSGNY